MDATNTRFITQNLFVSTNKNILFCPNLVSGKFSPKTKPKKEFPFPISCSTKPGLDSDNGTNKNSAIRMEPNAAPHAPSTAPPKEPISSKAVSKGLILDLGPRSSWDGFEIGSPVVKRFIGDDEERWYMWYHGSSSENGLGHIGLAFSCNGLHWARGDGPVKSSGDLGLVMGPREQWWAFDTNSVKPSDLVIMSSTMYSSVYWLYYSGYYCPNVVFNNNNNNKNNDNNDNNNNLEKYENGKILKSLPGLACSQDGRSWSRIEGDHHSGALFDVGSENEWDSSFIASPKVVAHGDEDLRMYYHSFDANEGRFCIGLARSRDGIRWVKMGKVLGGGGKGCFDVLGAKNGHVVRDPKDGSYLMAYEGVDEDGVSSIGLARSCDGLGKWDKIQDGFVFGPSKADGWDNKGVGAPYLVHLDGNFNEWRVYYQGNGGNGNCGIGMATSIGSEIRSLKKWEGCNCNIDL